MLLPRFLATHLENEKKKRITLPLNDFEKNERPYANEREKKKNKDSRNVFIKRRGDPFILVGTL